MNVKRIESVEDLLISYLESESDLNDIINNISFKLKYNDPILKGEVTTPYIHMLKEYQDSVYLAYLAMNDKPENITHLTDFEKEALSLKFKVEPGSDIFLAALENADKFADAAEGAISKMSGTEILILAAIGVGYLSIDKVTKLIETIKTKEIDVKVPLANIEREKKLYETFENITKDISTARFNKVKEEALHKPLYEYDNNTLETKEEIVTSQEAHDMKRKPTISTETIKGLFMVDGLRGASENKDVTTFWLIDENDREISIQLKGNDVDIMRKNLLFQNMGKLVDLELEVKKKDNVIKKKKVIYLDAA